MVGPGGKADEGRLVFMADSNIQRDRTFQLYIDEGGRIHICRGETDSFLGYSIEQLQQRSLIEFLVEESQIMYSEILTYAALAEPMGDSLLYLKNAKSGRVGAFRVNGGPQRFNDLFRLTCVFEPSLEYGPQSKNHRDGFIAAVEDAINSTDAEVDMTFVDIGDVDELKKSGSANSATVKKFTSNVETRLRSESLGGDAVGRIDSGKYGIVHKSGTNLDVLKDDLTRMAQQVDPKGVALNVATATVDLDDAEGMAEEAIRDALGHAVDEFMDAGIDSVIFDTLGASQTAFIEKRKTRTELLREVLDRELLTCGLRVVCDLSNWSADHLLAEFRADLDSDGLGAAEILKLTEKEPDLRTEVDIAQCRYIMGSEALDQVGIGVNLAVRSLLDPKVVQRLLEFAKRAPGRRVILRILGVKGVPIERIAAFDTLRQAGFKIALAGSELGSVTEERLKQMPIDFIMLDPSLVVNLDQLKMSLNGLAGMAKRCAENNITVIFEGVVEPEAAKLLGKIGKVYVTGPFFGDPVDNIDEIKLPVKAA